MITNTQTGRSAQGISLSPAKVQFALEGAGKVASWLKSFAGEPKTVAQTVLAAAIEAGERCGAWVSQQGQLTNLPQIPGHIRRDLSTFASVIPSEVAQNGQALFAGKPQAKLPQIKRMLESVVECKFAFFPELGIGLASTEMAAFAPQQTSRKPVTLSAIVLAAANVPAEQVHETAAALAAAGADFVVKQQTTPTSGFGRPQEMIKLDLKLAGVSGLQLKVVSTDPSRELAAFGGDERQFGEAMVVELMRLAEQGENLPVEINGEHQLQFGFTESGIIVQISATSSISHDQVPQIFESAGNELAQTLGIQAPSSETFTNYGRPFGEPKAVKAPQQSRVPAIA